MLDLENDGMQDVRTTPKLQSPFWLSLLFHLILLLIVSLTLIVPKNKSSEQPANIIQAYTYPEQKVKPMQRERMQKASPKPIQTQAEKEQVETAPKSEDLPLKPLQEAEPQTKPTTAQKPKPKRSILSASMDVLHDQQMAALSAEEDQEPIYLMGDMNGISDPFIILIAKALSAHFEYPKREGGLGAQGIVTLSLTLHPEGHFTNIYIVQSSYNDALDSAALYAANSAPQIHGVDKFISKPKRIVVGFVFEQRPY